MTTTRRVTSLMFSALICSAVQSQDEYAEARQWLRELRFGRMDPSTDWEDLERYVTRGPKDDLAQRIAGAQLWPFSKIKSSTNSWRRFAGEVLRRAAEYRDDFATCAFLIDWISRYPNEFAGNEASALEALDLMHPKLTPRALPAIAGLDHPEVDRRLVAGLQSRDLDTFEGAVRGMLARPPELAERWLRIVGDRESASPTSDDERRLVFLAVAIFATAGPPALDRWLAEKERRKRFAGVEGELGGIATWLASQPRRCATLLAVSEQALTAWREDIDSDQMLWVVPLLPRALQAAADQEHEPVAHHVARQLKELREASDSYFDAIFRRDIQALDDWLTRQTQRELRDIAQAVAVFVVRHARLPHTNEVNDESREFEFSNLTDPWGQDYVFRPLESGALRFEVISMGPDGRIGTKDDIVVTRP